MYNNFFGYFKYFLATFNNLNLEAEKCVILKLDMEELWCMKDYTVKKKLLKTVCFSQCHKWNWDIFRNAGSSVCTRVVHVSTCHLYASRTQNFWKDHQKYICTEDFIIWTLIRGLNSRKADIHYVRTTVLFNWTEFHDFTKLDSSYL